MRKKILLFLCAIFIGAFMGTIPAHAIATTFMNLYISGTSFESSNEYYQGAGASISYYSKPYVPSQTFSCAWTMIFGAGASDDSSLSQVGWVVDNLKFSDNRPRYFFGYAQNTANSFVSKELSTLMTPIEGASDGYRVIYDNSPYPSGGYGDVIGYINGVSYWRYKINWSPIGTQYAGEATSPGTQYPGKKLKHEVLSDVSIYRKIGSTGSLSWVHPGVLEWGVDTNGGIYNSSFMYNYSFEIWDTRY